MASTTSSDRVIYISSTSPSPAPESARAPSEKCIPSSPDPISLETTTADITAPPAKRRKISSDWAEDVGLYNPKNTNGRPTQSKPGHTLHGSGRELKHVQIPRASLPGVAYIGGSKDAVSEDQAIWRLGELPEVDGSKYVELNDYTIYRPATNKRSMEMCTLDKLNTAKGVDQLVFSGTLSIASATTSFYVQGVVFCTVAVDG